jgi:hypothetical protein
MDTTPFFEYSEGDEVLLQDEDGNEKGIFIFIRYQDGGMHVECQETGRELFIKMMDIH